MNIFTNGKFGSGTEYEVVMAMDINTNANLVYTHNFPSTVINSSIIESLTVKKFDSMRIDMILMSPPCQPFTRVGKQKDTEDVRTKSFLHVLDLLKKSENSPRYILLENVKGFECSDSRMRLVQTLDDCSYIFQEFLLTPLQFGIPNSRLRYFLIAKKKPSEFCFTSTDGIMDNLAFCPEDWFAYKLRAELETQSGHLKGQGQSCICRGKFPMSTDALECDTDKSVHVPCKRSNENEDRNSEDCKRQKQEDKKCCFSDDIPENRCENKASTYFSKNYDCLQNYGENMRQTLTEDQKTFGVCLKLYHFLERQFSNPKLFGDYLVGEKDFKRFMVMDIVNPCSQKTCCFTKRYGHYIDGAGSLVQMTADTQSIQKASVLKDNTTRKQNRDQWQVEDYETVRCLKLRYFTPREIANLLCFPENFDFPEGLTNRQKYMLLGNSLNVHIVSLLIRLMIKDS